MKISDVNLEVAMAKVKIKSFSELARRTKISRNSLTKYCSPEGIEKITLKNLMIICTELKCEINDIVEFDKEDKKENVI